MDSIPVQMARNVVEEVTDAHDRYTSGGISGSSKMTPDEMYDRIMSNSMFYHHKDYTGPVTNRSKWDRIAKPFIEEMVTFNRAVHFWNPAGKILGAIEMYMATNPDWDEV